MFKQVRNTRYYLQIVDQIREMIDSGKLKIGDKLPPERTLSEQFGTSRASIREALSALEIIGIVESRSGQGNFIKVNGLEAPIDGEMLKELLRSHSPYEIFEARLELEPNLAALTAERATEKEKAKLSKQVEKLNAIGKKVQEDPANIDAYMEEDRKYHLLIGKYAHNSVLFMVFSGVNLMMNEKHWKILKSKCITKDKNIINYEKEHNAILSAIIEKNANLAKNRIRKHIKGIEKDLFDR